MKANHVILCVREGSPFNNHIKRQQDHYFQNGVTQFAIIKFARQIDVIFYSRNRGSPGMERHFHFVSHAGILPKPSRKRRCMNFCLTSDF